jgi:hypothetical protein
VIKTLRNTLVIIGTKEQYMEIRNKMMKKIRTSLPGKNNTSSLRGRIIIITNILGIKERVLPSVKNIIATLVIKFI